MFKEFLSVPRTIDRETWWKTTGKRSFFYLQHSAIITLIVISLFLIPVATVFADDSGWKSPIPPDSVESSQDFGNPASVDQSDSSYAIAFGDSAFAVYKNFSFNMPSDATIHGIEARVQVRKCSELCNSSVSISLSADTGTTFSTGYSITAISTTDTFITVGGPTDTWGISWTGDKFNNANFRARLEANAGAEAILINVLQVKVYFTPVITGPSYTVTAVVSGGHGEVSPATQTVAAGETAQIDMFPDTDYYICGITDNGQPVAITNPYVINNIASDHDVVVTFCTGPAYTVIASISGGNGTVKPGSQIIGPGGTARIDISPHTGYCILGITDNGNSVPVTNPYIITNINANHNVVITFIRCSPSYQPNTQGIHGPDVVRNECPLTLTVDMMGEIKTATMTRSGVLCQECLAISPDKKNQFYLEEGTILKSTDQSIPLFIRFEESRNSIAVPANSVMVGSLFDLNAYPDKGSSTSIPLALEPDARLSLSYPENDLPENASEVHIAFFDTATGWNQINGIAGPAEIGTARGEVNHFTHFAVLAKTAPDDKSKFVIRDLSITPPIVKPQDEITIKASVVNESNAVSEYVARLMIDGVTIDSQIHNLPPQESKQLLFVTIGNIGGIHQVKIGNASGQFEVITEKKFSSDWIIWVIIAIVVFCIWRFRKAWFGALRQILS